VNPIDDAADDAADGGGVERATREMSILDQGVLRELSEELDLRFVGKSAPPAVPLGVINDDSTSVGSVHFGVVYGIGVSPETTIREKDHMVGDWLPWSQLCEEAASGANYETWSSILLRSLAAEDIRAAHAGESQSHKSSATRALKSAGAVLGGSAS
jgi:hypothetical protein